jgi:hypothetical protein
MAKQAVLLLGRVAPVPSHLGTWETTNPNASGPNHQLNSSLSFWRGQAEGGRPTAGGRGEEPINLSALLQIVSSLPAQ